MLADARTSADAYSVQYSLPASQHLQQLRSEVRLQIRQRLQEIAEVARYFSNPATAEIKTPLGLEVAGHAVTYVLSDGSRTLLVLSVVPAGATEPGEPGSSSSG